MTGRRILEIGGIIAGTLMIAFGVGALVMSINARNTVGDELKAEQIVGSADMNPTAITVGDEGGRPPERRGSLVRRRRAADPDRW